MKKILFPLLILSFNSFAYNREADYGGWQDYDGDCQDTRAEVLISRSLSQVEFSRSDNCYVKTGKWIDYYTGKTYTNAKDVQIDHLISLKQHYEAIGSTLTHAQRVEYANNPAHLVIANSTLNMSKSDKDLSEFIFRVTPQNKCKYIKDYKKIADANNITLDKSDNEAINQNPACFKANNQ